MARPAMLARATLLLIALCGAGASDARAGSQAEPLFPIVEHSKWGLIDATGRTVITPRFDAIAPYGHGMADESWFPGAPISAFNYMTLRDPLGKGLVRTELIGVEIGGKWGYVDRADRTVVEPRFDELNYNTDDPPRVRLPVRNGKKWGYINRAGQLVIEANYDEAWSFVEDVALTRIGKRWVVIDSMGADVAGLDAEDVDFHSWESVEREIVGVKIGSKWGAMDRRGHLVIEPRFDSMGNIADGLINVYVGKEKQQKGGYIDRTGAVIIPANFDIAAAFDGNIALVRVGRQWGIINRTGAFVMAPSADRIRWFEGDVAVFTREDTRGRPGRWGRRKKLGLLDRRGRVLLEPTYEEIGPFVDGLARVLAWGGGRAGYIDTTGTVAIELRFEDVGDFSEGLAPVLVGETWGYIDRTGAVVIPPQFPMRPSGFVHGLATVEESDGQSFTDVSYIDLNARVVYSMRFTGVWTPLPLRRRS